MIGNHSVIPVALTPLAKARNFSAVIFLGLAIAGLLNHVLFTSGASPPTVSLPFGDVVDPPSHDIAEATFHPSLVQWGSPRNYTGNGPPGVTLDVITPGIVLNWSLVSWANQTSPPTYSTCALPFVHYSQYDWLFQAKNNGGGGQGTFVTTPTTVPQRLGPNGDQCFARAGATGTWHVTICVEGKEGGPRGIYDGEDGRRHIDTWDRCVEQDFQVQFP